MMSESLIVHLAKSIGYPQEVPAEAESFDFLVDGEVISAEAEVKKTGAIERSEMAEGLREERILLKTVLTEDEAVAGRLATYAAGRLLKEDAALAWDPEKRAVILWEKVRLEGQARRAFESFCESADWWRDRVKESGAPDDSSNKFLIRP